MASGPSSNGRVTARTRAAPSIASSGPRQGGNLLFGEREGAFSDNEYCSTCPGECSACISSVFDTRAFAPQAGTFVLQFDTVPQHLAMDAVMGTSNGPASRYTNLAAI